MVVLQTPPDVAYFPLLVLALITGVILASALAILLSSVNVYLRDTQHLIEVVLTAWFWACPIVYPYWTDREEAGAARAHVDLPPQPRDTARADLPALPLRHPVVPINGVVTQVLPTQGYLWYAALVLGVLFLSVVLFLVALAVFGRLEGNFAEEL